MRLNVHKLATKTVKYFYDAGDMKVREEEVVFYRGDASAKMVLVLMRHKRNPFLKGDGDVRNHI